MKFIKKFLKLFKKKKVRNYTDKEIFNYAQKLIKCARIDYEASKVLFKQKKKEYSVILYHLQQTVEKLVKAETILRKSISIDELKEVSHKSPKVFMMGLEKAMRNKEINSFLKDKIPKDKLKEANRYLYNPKKIINSAKEELLAILNFYEVFKNLGIIPGIYEEAKQKIKDVKLELNMDRNETFMNLYFLSWITFPYSEITRYPNGKINPYEYDKTKPIVQVIPDIIKKIEPLIKFMENYKFENEK